MHILMHIYLREIYALAVAELKERPGALKRIVLFLAVRVAVQNPPF